MNFRFLVFDRQSVTCSILTSPGAHITQQQLALPVACSVQLGGLERLSLVCAKLFELFASHHCQQA